MAGRQKKIVSVAMSLNKIGPVIYGDMGNLITYLRGKGLLTRRDQLECMDPERGDFRLLGNHSQLVRAPPNKATPTQPLTKKRLPGCTKLDHDLR